MLDRRSMVGVSAGALVALSLAACSQQLEGRDMIKGKTMDHVFVWIEIQAAAGHEDQIRETFAHTIKTSHKPGIISAQIFEHAGEPGRFYSLQEWESEAAFREHMTGSRDGLDSQMEMMRGAPSLTILKSLG